jgi:hypothetical protein
MSFSANAGMARAQQVNPLQSFTKRLKSAEPMLGFGSVQNTQIMHFLSAKILWRMA